MDQLHDANPLEKRLVAKATIARIPITAAFELTPICNMHCEMCYIRMEKQAMNEAGGALRSDYWLQQASELKKLGTLFILLTGGEPILHPDFCEIYTRLREMGFILTLNTNGTLITEDIARMFHKLKPRRVNVTLYGASNESYRKICHTPQGFDQCMQGISLLKKYDIDTKINLSIVKENKDELHKILDIAQSLDIPAEVNSYMFACKRSDCSNTLHIPDIRLDAHQAGLIEISYLRYKHKENLCDIAQIQNVVLEKTPSQIPGIGLDCRAGKSSCWLNWKGEMTPCCVIERPTAKINETPIGEIWKNIVEQCETLPIHTECKDCKLRTVCNVCYAAAEHEKKITGEISYLCDMAKTKKEELKKIANEKNKRVH